MVPLLKLGSRGPLVADLQRALNIKLTPSPRLVTDGAFGPVTDRAVRAFQDQNWLVVDGVAGVCTQNALYGKEAYPPALHNIPFIPQPTNTTCWAASTAMMTFSSVAAVKAKTPQDMWSDQAGLLNSSETDDAMTSGNRYARIRPCRGRWESCGAPCSAVR
jgi:peptidoglycan hydrolase-like protein with peptidoglycan-binding domain